MKKITGLLSIVLMGALPAMAGAEEEPGHMYLGAGLTSLGLDGERVPGVPTTSPGHTPKVGELFLGYQFNSRWAADLSVGTDLSNNVDTNVFAINGYRMFTDNSWRPYISFGGSSFGISDAVKDRTQQLQAGIGVSGELTEKLELRAGFQRSFTLSDPSYDDDSFMLSLNWHFRKPKAVAAAQPAPQPESVPKKKEVVDTYELKVLFDFDKATIKTSYKPQFDEIAAIMQDNPDISMTVEGHTDWTGTEAYNQGLSERRAEAVKQKFIADYGISPDRITAVGYGETRPVADNKTREGRQQNRRAIAVILKTRMVTE